jgi:hypothetical protein
MSCPLRACCCFLIQTYVRPSDSPYNAPYSKSFSCRRQPQLSYKADEVCITPEILGRMLRNVAMQPYKYEVHCILAPA